MSLGTLLCFFLFTSSCSYLEQCSAEVCTKPYVIQEPTNVDLEINLRDSKITVFEYPESADVIHVNRRKWSNYCYDGTSLSPNTGCISSTKDLPPNRSEALLWKSKGMCMIGHECEPDGSCWGSDANKCLDDGPFRFVTESNLKWVGQRSLMFLHHSCISSWECKVHVMKLPIRSKIEGGVISSYFPLSNGTMVKTPTNDDLRISLSSYERLYFNEVLKLNSYSTSASCVVSPSKVACIVKDKGKDIDLIPFNLEKGNTCASHRNLIFCIKGKLEGWDSEYRPIIWKEGTIEYAPAALLSVEELQVDLKTTNLQFSYNTIQLIREINSLYRGMKNIVMSLSKIDDHLIGNMINQDYNTRWLSPKVFKMCSQTDGKWSEKTCLNGRKFRMGRFVETDTPCIGINIDKVSNLSLFGNANLLLDEYRIERSEVSSDHLESWSWIANHRSSIISLIEGRNKKDDLPTKQSSSVFSAWFFDIYKYMHLIGFALSIFNFCVLCIFFRR